MLCRSLEDFPESAHLHFMNGALHAQIEDYQTALINYQTALNLAPDYHIARFQLGLLLATLEQKTECMAIMRPLSQLNDHYLGQFAVAIMALLENALPQAIAALNEGLRINHEIPSLSNDMRALLQRISSNDEGINREVSTETVKSDDDKSHLLDIYQAKH